MTSRAIFIPAWILLGLACCIGGCSVGPDYEPPKSMLPGSWNVTSSQPDLPSSKTLASYWRELEDKTLNKLISLALDSNPTLTEASFALEEVLASYRVQRGEYFPDIDLTGTVQKRRRSAAVASAIAGLNNDFTAIGGVMGWELDILGRIRRLNESANARVEVAQEDVHGAMVSLQAELALAYISYRTLEAQIALTKKNIRTQKESLDIAKERFQAGVAPQLDVKQAESNLGSTRAALPRLRIEAARQRHLLAVLIGGFPEQLASHLSVEGKIPALPSVDQKTLPVNILRQRPDVRRAERELAAQHALIGAAEAELYPIISLPGNFSFQALNTLEDAFLRDSLAYSIGPAVNWNFLDFGRVRGRIDAQEARALQAKQRYKQRVLQAVQQVEDAMVELREQKARIEALQYSVEASRESVDLVRSLYVSGLTDFQNVLNSERLLFEQEINLAQSEGAAVAAFVTLFRSLGGGWNQGEIQEGDKNDKTSSDSKTLS